MTRLTGVRESGNPAPPAPAPLASRFAPNDEGRPASLARTLTPRSAAALPAPLPIERIAGGVPLPGDLRGAIVALGNFDGVHLGHQAVVARTVAMARARGVAAIVATFDPHPVRYFRPGSTPFRLTTLDQRQRLLAEAGADAMMVFAFDRNLANVTPEGFVYEWLRDAGGIVTGANFAFGRDRAGSVELLASLSAARGLACETVGPVPAGAVAISSSRVRAALREGDCGAAARLLTRPFKIEGAIGPGRRMDPGLPLLDASLGLGEYLRPRAGVYAVRGRLADGRVLGGSAYLARASTHDPSPALELFLVDITERDLGAWIEIEFVAHLHDAREVYDRPTLRRRIEGDRAAGRALASSLVH